jgi:hypothetical protein
MMNRSYESRKNPTLWFPFNISSKAWVWNNLPRDGIEHEVPSRHEGTKLLSHRLLLIFNLLNISAIVPILRATAYE